MLVYLGVVLVLVALPCLLQLYAKSFGPLSSFRTLRVLPVLPRGLIGVLLPPLPLEVALLVGPVVHSVTPLLA